LLLGEPVGYVHNQTAYVAEEQALPLGYGRVGEYALILMLSDPSVTFFLVNGGGHLFFSPVQNPAWDFCWVLNDYPLHQPVGFDGRLIYTRWRNQAQVLARYQQWLAQRDAGKRER